MSRFAGLYTIRGGEVTKSLIAKEGTVIQAYMKGSGKTFKALRSEVTPEDENFEGITLSNVVGIASILTPWATWYACPDISNDKDWLNIGGQAYVKAERAVVRSSLKPVEAVRVALHEAFHLAEDYLSLEEMKAIGSGMDGLPMLPNDDFHSYYSSDIEVRANAFMHWAMSHWLRGRIPEYRRGMPADERVWTMIYRGDLGIRVARHGLIPTSRQPAHIKVALAERTATQLLSEAIGRSVRAIKKWVTDSSKTSVKAAA